MKLQISVAALTLVALASSTIGLTYLGRIGNKTYFVETGTSMPWASGSTYCSSNNMDFGTINSATERGFLVNAIRTIVNKHVTAWTDGVEKFRTTSFIWNSTQADAPNATIVIGRPTNCLRFEVTPTADDFSEYSCIISQNVLCQIVD